MGKAGNKRDFFKSALSEKENFFIEMHHQKGGKGEPEGDG